MYLTIPVTRGDMLENAKNPESTVMRLLCLTVSLLGSQLNCIFQILCASEPFQSMLPVLRDTFASWKATRDDLTHSCSKATLSGSEELLKLIQVYKS